METLEGYEVETEKQEANKQPAKTIEETKVIMFPGVIESADEGAPQSADTESGPKDNIR